jgi:hypothetical protein
MAKDTCAGAPYFFSAALTERYQLTSSSINVQMLLTVTAGVEKHPLKASDKNANNKILLI